MAPDFRSKKNRRRGTRRRVARFAQVHPQHAARTCWQRDARHPGTRIALQGDADGLVDGDIASPAFRALQPAWRWCSGSEDRGHRPCCLGIRQQSTGEREQRKHECAPYAKGQVQIAMQRHAAAKLERAPAQSATRPPQINAGQRRDQHRDSDGADDLPAVVFAQRERFVEAMDPTQPSASRRRGENASVRGIEINALDLAAGSRSCENHDRATLAVRQAHAGGAHLCIERGFGVPHILRVGQRRLGGDNGVPIGILPTVDRLLVHQHAAGHADESADHAQRDPEPSMQGQPPLARTALRLGCLAQRHGCPHIRMRL